MCDVVPGHLALDVGANAAQNWSMDDQDLRLPMRLKQLRRAMGLTQRQAAIKAGLDVSWLCNLECGRRIGPSDEVIGRLCAGLGINQQIVRELVRLASHDRVLRVVHAEAPGSVGLISAALDAGRELDAHELDGLARQVDEIIKSKRRLKQLAETAP